VTMTTHPKYASLTYSFVFSKVDIDIKRLL